MIIFQLVRHCTSKFSLKSDFERHTIAWELARSYVTQRTSLRATRNSSFLFHFIAFLSLIHTNIFWSFLLIRYVSKNIILNLTDSRKKSRKLPISFICNNDFHNTTKSNPTIRWSKVVVTRRECPPWIELESVT